MKGHQQHSVLIVSPNNLGDGSDYVLEEIAIECSKRFERVEVIYLKQLNGKGWKNLPGNVFTHCLNAKTYNGGIFSLLLFLRKKFFRQQFYFSLSSNIHINASLGIAKFLGFLKTDFLIARESTVIFERFGFWKKLNYKMRYWLGYPFVDKVICQTEGMKKSLTTNISSLTKKCVVIYNPLNIKKIELGASETIEGIERFKPFILSVGRLISEKQISMLIDAYQLLLNKKTNLLIVGDGTERNNLQKQIDDLGLSQKVFLFGYATNPYPLMKQADICVLTSRHEGFPNSLLQMLVLNNNCISTNNCDVLQEIPTLKIVNNHVAVELSKAIEAMLDGNNFEKNELENKKFFLQKLNPKNFVNSLLQALSPDS